MTDKPDKYLPLQFFPEEEGCQETKSVINIRRVKHAECNIGSALLTLIEAVTSSFISYINVFIYKLCRMVYTICSFRGHFLKKDVLLM